jgi:hypothetical protein
MNLSTQHIKEELDKLKTPIRSQNILSNELDHQIQSKLRDLVNKYGDIKTILPISELLQFSEETRKKTILRPQNYWILYRKDISKGLRKAKIKSLPGDTSRIASNLRNSISNHEELFWRDLSFIIKDIHLFKHPNYKFHPKRIQKKKICKNYSAENLENTMNTMNNYENTRSEMTSTSITQSLNVDSIQINSVLLLNNMDFRLDGFDDDNYFFLISNM